jgi:hypothetical protein
MENPYESPTTYGSPVTYKHYISELCAQLTFIWIRIPFWITFLIMLDFFRWKFIGFARLIGLSGYFLIKSPIVGLLVILYLDVIIFVWFVGLLGWVFTGAMIHLKDK